MSSDKNFGLVFASAFTVLGLWPLLTRGPVRPFPLALAAVFLAFALWQPAALHPLNRAWTVLGVLLSRIVNPVVTAVLFYAIFTPAGLISRFLGRDPLRLKPAPLAESYWIVRHPPGPAPETMSKQF
ncbi:MAG TPA: hypothetical protein VM120_12715 [Bryobacteraceae bacterium]|nr:hypothetical protein [Bryobacteraceae bacterium]